MRRTIALFLSLLVGLPALAQNVAPVQNNAQTHVTPEQKSAATGTANKAAAAEKMGAPAPENASVVLDSVIAIVNGDVLLQSDVEEERRFESLQLLSTDENNDVRAAQHLITRTLILQQMKEQNQDNPGITQADTDKVVNELKKQLPGCLPTRCQSEAGWTSYLAERGLTPVLVEQRWRQRLVILNYVNLRFREGIRVPPADVQSYYEKQLVPQFEAKHEKAPTLKTLRPRIEELLVQEAVTKQVNDWETTLREEGSVQILVPAYGKSSEHDEEDDLAGGGL
ncbi:peptidylprolyl isomerase [Acidipila sp. EB88]|uniref:peptidylprolyl isomerase n=1 Tax=Acidipila sp. EB88 TaxID=2305226 RepID=UPI000F5F1F6B|nr:peptidylprolyl isomerase [Acidipila sp. EB88]RRA47293.1 peptidylprolyl isomerase [Acidipila sp. EB88]